MEELIHVIMLWLSVTFGLPETKEIPRVRHMPPQHMAAIHHGRLEATENDDVVAIYDKVTRTILLRPGWDSSNVADVSVLVHELVHHLQNQASLEYNCREEREALAYKAQERWLEFFEEDIESAFQIDKFSLMLKTNCLPY